MIISFPRPCVIILWYISPFTKSLDWKACFYKKTLEWNFFPNTSVESCTMEMERSFFSTSHFPCWWRLRYSKRKIIFTCHANIARKNSFRIGIWSICRLRHMLFAYQNGRKSRKKMRQIWVMWCVVGFLKIMTTLIHRLSLWLEIWKQEYLNMMRKLSGR